MTDATKSTMEALCAWLTRDDRSASLDVIRRLFSPRFVFDDGSQELVGEDALFRLHFVAVEPLDVCVGDDRAALTFEAMDQATGLGSRQLWFFTLRSGRIERILGIPTDRTPVPATVDYGRCPSPAHHRHLETHYGFRTRQPEDARLIAEAHDALERELRVIPAYDASRVLLNTEYIFFPVGWIGCGGALVGRRSLEVRLLGTPLPVGVQVWALDRGFPLGDTVQDRRVDFVVTAVRDVGQTLRVLSLLRTSLRTEALEPGLDTLPLVLSGIDVYFELYHLWQAEAHGWFTFHVRGRAGPTS
jgi:hypothetical protein